jgi:class 3 adenylate cyclase/tetratricopeptide (TPR) repeat protein
VTSSTALGERLDPEALRSLMSLYYDCMRRILERHGGTVAKFIGDAVLAVFGVPTLHEDDPVRAVRAASEIPAAIKELNTELERRWSVTIGVRIGVNTGQIVAARNPLVATEMVLGDPVNIAARLEQAAESGQILLGSPTYELVRDAVEARPLGSLTVKGKELPVRAWQLLTVTSGAPGHLRQMGSPIVGRMDELALLGQAFRRAVREQRCFLFTLLGPAGVGKSRLISEFLADTAHEATILSGNCPSYGEGVTFWPVAAVVRQAIGLLQDDTAESALAKLHQFWRGEEQAATATKPLAGLLGLAHATAVADELPYSLRLLFESVARRRPLVVVFDDLQWAEPRFLELVEYLADWFRNGPLLLVGIARSEFVEAHPTWAGGKVNAMSILLEPLSVEETSLLATNLASGRLPEDVEARVTRAAAGVPLFVEEFVRMLIDDGFLTRIGDRWTSTKDLASIPVPATIHALLTARLEMLADHNRTILQRASVVGSVFDEDEVAELLPAAERPLLDERLGELVHTELIAHDHRSFAKRDIFRFRHDLIRDAAYESLPKQQRAELHERLAAWMELGAGARPAADEELLGYHLERACQVLADLGPLDGRARQLAQAAATHLGAAGRSAFYGADSPAACKLFRRAIALLPIDGPELPGLKAELGIALLEAGALVEADALLSEAASTAGDERLARRAAVEQAWLAMQIHTDGVALDRLHAQANESVAAFTAIGDDRGLAATWLLLAEVRCLEGAIATVTDAARQALEHARRADDPRTQGHALLYLVLALDVGPTPVREAIETCEALLSEVPGRRWHTRTLATLAHLEAKEGKFMAAREQIQRARVINEEVPFTINVPWVNWCSGQVEQLAGNMTTAERDIRRAYDMCRDSNEKGISATMGIDLAEAVAAQGRDGEALRITEESEKDAAAEDLWVQAAWRSTRARILIRQHQTDMAERFAREAIRLASRTDMLELHAGALLALVEVLRAAGRHTATWPLLEQAAGLYRQKGNLVALEALETGLGERGQLETGEVNSS